MLKDASIKNGSMHAILLRPFDICHHIKWVGAHVKLLIFSVLIHSTNDVCTKVLKHSYIEFYLASSNKFGHIFADVQPEILKIG